MTLNLDQFQTRQAETKKKSADEAVDLRITEAYQWLLVPGQPDPKGEVTWTDLKLQGQDSLATRAAKKLKNEESLVMQMGGVGCGRNSTAFRSGPATTSASSSFASTWPATSTCRGLRDEQVLIAAIQEGVASLTWQSDTFAYAEGWDEQRQRYQGLQAGTSDPRHRGRPQLSRETGSGGSSDSRKTEQARSCQRRRPGRHRQDTGGGPTRYDSQSTARPNGKTGDAAPPAKLGRFHGSVPVDPLRLGRDAARIAEEVVQHLTGLVGSNVEITIEIHAELADGAGDKLVRDVTENCRTLKFTDYGFESE